MGGLTYIEALKKNLPMDLQQAMMYRGPDPHEVILYESKLEEVGRLFENHKRKVQGNTSTNPEKSGNKRKRGKGGKDSKDSEAPAPKKPDTGNTKCTWTKGQAPKWRSDQKEERTAGLNQAQIDSRMKRNLCISCGDDKHRWQWCPNTIKVSSLRRISSVKKGKKGKSEDSAPATTTLVVSCVNELPQNTVGPEYLDYIS